MKPNIIEPCPTSPYGEFVSPDGEIEGGLNIIEYGGLDKNNDLETKND